MNQLAPLLALDFPTIKLIFALVVGLVWLLNYLLGGRQQGKVPPVVNRPNVRRPGLNPPADAAAPRTRTQESLSSEIEQFLQEAAQRKRDKGRRPGTKPGPVRVAKPEVPLDVELLEPPTGEAISDSVKRHLDTGVFAERAMNLTEDMKRADVEREEHIKQTFDRRLGNLTDTSQGQAESSADSKTNEQGNLAAAVVGNLLTKPENLRQAIVLNEILTRPRAIAGNDVFQASRTCRSG